VKSTRPVPIRTSSPSFVGSVGHSAVFSVHGFDVWAEDVDCIDWIGFAVENQVAVSSPTPRFGISTSWMVRDTVVGVS